MALELRMNTEIGRLLENFLKLGIAIGAGFILSKFFNIGLYTWITNPDILALLILAMPCFGALEFNGTDQYVALPQLLTNPTEITIGGWFTVDDTNAEYRVLTHNNREPYVSFRFNQGAIANRLQINIKCSDSEHTLVTEAYTLTDLHSIFLTAKEGAYAKLYIDGIEVDNVASIGNFIDTGANYNNRVGCDRGDPPGHFSPGVAFDIRVYGRQLSLAEIRNIYYSRGNDNIVDGLVGRWRMDEKPDGTVASGTDTVIDISGNGNHGTPYNSPVYRSAPVRLRRIIYIPFPVHFSRFIQDSGSGADNIAQITNALSVQDSGAGTDVPSIVASSSISDTGTGLDSISALIKQFKTVSDIGTGADLVSILAKIALSDSGVGAETILGNFQKWVSDTGTGIEALSILVHILVEESGVGIDEILKRASFQYKIGKVAVVKGSSIVTGTNTFWQNKIRAGDLFKIKGENAVYVVSAVNSDTELVLSSDYVGESKEEVDYIIHRFFTSNYLFPLLTGKTEGYDGDEDWGELYRWTVRKIDRLLKSVEG